VQLRRSVSCSGVRSQASGRGVGGPAAHAPSRARATGLATPPRMSATFLDLSIGCESLSWRLCKF
jgi:hypothetical protein